MIPWRVRSFDLLDSTNDVAKEAAALGEAEGLVIVAARQKAGRGRRGRVWDSPEGNLYVSILLRPAADMRVWGQYGFLTALAIRDSIGHFLPSGFVTLKWPNDVLLNGKKMSGLLMEKEEDALILGIGVNLAQHPTQTLYPCTSLKQEGASITPTDYLQVLLARCADWFERLEKEGWEALRHAWLTHAQKGSLTVQQGMESLSGTFSGLDEVGNLRLALPDGTLRTIVTGDVFFPLDHPV